MPRAARSVVMSLVPGAPLIQVEHLTRTIGRRNARTTIFDDITFTVPAHSLFAIVGPSGSGKSTVLNMLTEVGRPTSGRVPFAFDPVSLVVMLVFTLIVATLASVLPALRTSRARVVEALRYE